MFAVISEYSGDIWYKSDSYEDCQEYLNNCQDVANEKELAIKEIN